MMLRSLWKIATLSALGAVALSTSAMACAYGDCGRYGYVYGPAPGYVYAPFAVVGPQVYLAPPVVTYAPPPPVYVAPACAAARVYVPAPGYGPAYGPGYGPGYAGYAPGWGGYAAGYPGRRWRGW
jgi:hypothetical protein